jgi:hypothetical protein
MHWRCIEDALKMHWICIEDAWKMHWTCIEHAQHWRCIEDALEMHWRCIEDALKMYWRCVDLIIIIIIIIRGVDLIYHAFQRYYHHHHTHPRIQSFSLLIAFKDLWVAWSSYRRLVVKYGHLDGPFREYHKQTNKTNKSLAQDQKKKLKMHWRCIGDALKMHWRCIGDALEMHWGCIEDALEMHWRCIGDALNLHPNFIKFEFTPSSTFHKYAILTCVHHDFNLSWIHCKSYPRVPSSNPHQSQRNLSSITTKLSEDGCWKANPWSRVKNEWKICGCMRSERNNYSI